MATVQSSFTLNDFPAEMVTAVAAYAVCDAHCVGLFLSRLGIRGTPEKPLSVPAGFLLHLGAAFRLLTWEAQGFYGHREAGLPEAEQAIRDAFLSLVEPAADPSGLLVAVMRLSVERFAWSGLPELGADIILDEAQEDALLEALADYLWTHR